MDVGTFLRSGAKADLKLNLVEAGARFAIAPRLGAGYRWGRRIAMLEGGAIASYRVSSFVEPYLGLTYANHWIEAEAPSAPLGPDAVRRRETGDGLLQLDFGIELPLSNDVALVAEYGHWFPPRDEPGDFCAFVPTKVAGSPCASVTFARRASFGGGASQAKQKCDEKSSSCEQSRGHADKCGGLGH